MSRTKSLTGGSISRKVREELARLAKTRPHLKVLWFTQNDFSDGSRGSSSRPRRNDGDDDDDDCDADSSHNEEVRRSRVVINKKVSNIIDNRNWIDFLDKGWDSHQSTMRHSER